MIEHAVREYPLESVTFSGIGDYTKTDTKELQFRLKPMLVKVADGSGGYSWQIIE